MQLKLLAFSLCLAVLATGPASAAASVSVDINGAAYTGSSNPKGVKLVAGQPFSVDITITGKTANPIWLKHGDDVQMNGASNDAKPDADAYSFYLVPMHPGPLTIPGLDIAMADGSSLHMDPIKLVVYPQ
jgi:hypothetical protein